MNRFLSLLVGGLCAAAVGFGCSAQQPQQADDDDSNSGSGNKPASGGMGNPSGGSAGSGSGAAPAGGTAGSGVSAGGAGGSVTTGGAGGSVTTGGAGGSVTTGGAGGSVATGGAGGSVTTGGAGGSVTTGGAGGSVTTGGAGGAGGAGGTGATGGAGGGGSVPPGYWSYQDWHGCAWTGIDTDTTATTRTTITPKDFTTGVTDGAYCVSGSVGNTYESVALLGFNLNQPSDGTSCVYDPNAATAAGPPGVSLTKTGIAVNFSKTGAFTLRVQIQAQDGATNADHRWCYTITDAAGPVFAPYNKFNSTCWDGKGTNYDGTTPISAVVFLVPGATSVTPYNFCINGFAAGDSAADAPTGGMQSGPLTGTIGGAGSTDLDFQRVKVKVDGHSYIIQNNNWGNPSGSDQTLTYSDNSFKVTQSTGSGSSAPASFPSIYIGANGDTQMGTYSTTSDDHLPKQISAITSVMTSFGYTVAGNMNAAYDIWFASSPPSACYGDGVSGFIMLWFHQPSGFHPIGSSMASANIGGHGWDVWVGPRGGTGSSNGKCQVSNSNAPVVSYVAQGGDLNNVSNLDLKPFFTDAASHGISSSWYLTDVFGGMEIWSGGSGAAVTKFSAVVAP